MLDAFDAAVFEEFLHDNHEIIASFKDFTYYPDTISSFGFTMYSLPEILTGKYFDPSIEKYPDFLNRALCYKRAYDIVDGKIYYVEYFYNINVFTETGYPNSAISKIYYKNNEIAFIEEGYEGDKDFDRYYITSFSNTIDESKFEIPTDYKWLKSE